MGGLLGWRKTTARYPADSYKVLPLYLLLLCLFYIHVGEEAITKFNQGIASLSGKPWSDAEFTFLIALIGPVAWVFAAWSLWLRQPFGNFILWFMIVGMILGEPVHYLVFPVVAMNKFGIDYQYFSGMYTALFPIIPAILALVVIVQDHKQRLAHSKGMIQPCCWRLSGSGYSVFVMDMPMGMKFPVRKPKTTALRVLQAATCRAICEGHSAPR